MAWCSVTKKHKEDYNFTFIGTVSLQLSLELKRLWNFSQQEVRDAKDLYVVQNMAVIHRFMLNSRCFSVLNKLCRRVFYVCTVLSYAAVDLYQQ